MKIPFLAPKRKQGVLIATEDGRIVRDTLEVEKGYAACHKTLEAWALDAGNQVKERKTGALFQVLTEKSIAPIVLNGKSNIQLAQNTLNKVNEMTVDQEIVKIEKRSAKNKILWALVLIAVLFAISVMAMILFTFFMSGKVHMPF